MKKEVKIFFISLSCNSLFAQTKGSISVTVKDKNTQEELIGVVL